MATDYASAVRAGTMAAARLHRQLGSREIIETQGGSIDAFSAIFAIDLPLLLRPLQGLLGAYLNDPAPGVLVTTRRPMSIQRFTAAPELGHFALRHEPSLDDESILRRIPLSGQSARQLPGNGGRRFRRGLHDASLASYLWDIEQLKASGFAVVRDEREALDSEAIGGPVVRRVTATPEAAHRGRMSLDERRPWQPASPLSQLILEFDLTDPEEEGLSRAERRHLLQVA